MAQDKELLASLERAMEGKKLLLASAQKDLATAEKLGGTFDGSTVADYSKSIKRYEKEIAELQRAHKEALKS